MLINLNKIVIEYRLDIKGVIHIGAHYGQEYSEYLKQGVHDMIFFEPVKENYKRLKKHLSEEQGVTCFNLALGNEIG